MLTLNTCVSYFAGIPEVVTGRPNDMYLEILYLYVLLNHHLGRVEMNDGKSQVQMYLLHIFP